MPLLGADDDLAQRPLRVIVAGTSGSGKTTLASRIGDILAIPHIEIDALYHGPGWTERPSFLDDVQSFIAKPAWVTEWQYSAARPLLAEGAELMVWLDLPRVTVMKRVVWRSWRRRAGRQELWNGNLEPPISRVFTDPDHIIRWAWNRHRMTGLRVGELQQLRPELVVVRLENQREVKAWIEGPLKRAGELPAPPIT